MNAMLFAAGLGTRLRPYTLNTPKAMVKVNGIPLIRHAINLLSLHGVDKIVINIHYMADQIIDYIEQIRSEIDAELVFSDEQDLVLETGGGLKKAAPLLGDQPFIVYNVDVLSNIDLSKMYKFHIENNHLATLAVRQRTSSRYLLFDDNQQLCAWKNTKTGEEKVARVTDSELQNWAFSGIHIISPQIFDLMPPPDKYSIIPIYLEAAKTHKVMAYPHDQDFWMDVGRPEHLERAHELIKSL